MILVSRKEAKQFFWVVNLDRFPEAFKRFESVVEVDSFRSYRELVYAFSRWSGKRWKGSHRQNLALLREGKRLGFKDAKSGLYFRRQPRVFVRQAWRRETVAVGGRSQIRYRDLRTGRFIKKP